MSFTLAQCQHCKAINKLNSETSLQKKPTCGKCAQLLPMHGLASEVAEGGFEKILKNAGDKVVVVDFWAEWCGPCKMYGPEFEKASKENPESIFLKVDTERDQALSQRFGIRGIPCTILFKNGVEVKRQAGAMNAAQVTDLIRNL